MSMKKQQQSVFNVSVALPTDKTITLQNVCLGDTVMSLRQLIAEMPELTCYTCYHLELKDGDNWIVMNDFAELVEYHTKIQQGLVRMVLDLYDARKARAHLHRLREVLSNPPLSIAPASSIEPDSEKEAKELTPADQKEEQLKKFREILAKIQPATIPLPIDLTTHYPTSKSKTSLALPKCVKSIALSGYNPPPGPRKLAGDLFYLEVTTLDDIIHHLTAHVTGFYVNKTTLAAFDPTAAKQPHTSHLLWDVLCNVSSSFRENYEKLLAHATALAKDGPMSLETIVSAGLVSTRKPQWTVPTASGHEFDLNRAEDEICSTYGMDERGVMRDWNEEFQCCKELPASTEQEKIMRQRVQHKVVSEFVHAAKEGIMAVIEGHIPPINPMDQETSHVFVYNNIFFSRSVKDPTLESEAAAYTSANHDLQGVVAFNQADIPGLHTLATTLVDYLGIRMIAQSIIPGILQGEAASKLVYGSVDYGQTIASNPKMHEMMLQASEKLNLAVRKMKPIGKVEELPASALENGEAGTDPVDLCGPVEAKGILGSDGRYYVLDLVRITPRDATYYDATENALEKGLKFEREEENYAALLRPEAVQLFTLWKQSREKQAFDKVQKEKKNESEETETFVPTPIRLNPNVFMERFEACADPEQAKQDEALAREAAEYLQTIVIPALVSDMRQSNFTPVDGVALTDTMHSCGINMRYLGRLATIASEVEKNNGMQKYVVELLEREMIARVAKHMVTDMMNENPTLRATAGAALINFLNSIFGSVQGESCPKSKSKKNKKKNKKKSTSPVKISPALTIVEQSSGSVWTDIETRVRKHFGYKLQLHRTERCYPLPLLRRICHRLGLQMEAKAYDFKSATPFTAADLVGVFPVVKSSLPENPSQDAKTLIERGRILLNRSVLGGSYEALQEAASMLYQVCGSSHPDAALCSSTLATVFYHAGDIASALLQQQRALALYTQLMGVDHHDTAFAHANIAIFLHANGQTDEAIKHMQRSIYLLELAGGPSLPEVCSFYFKLGMMYQDVGHIQMALLCHRESLTRGEFNRLQAATTLHQMAIAYSMTGAFRPAMSYEKKANTLYSQMFGDEDPRTVESNKRLSLYTQKAVEGAKNLKEKELASAADAVADELANAELIPKAKATAMEQQEFVEQEDVDGFTPIVSKKNKKKTSKKN